MQCNAAQRLVEHCELGLSLHHTHTHACTHALTYARTHVCTHARTHAHTHTHTSPNSPFTSLPCKQHSLTDLPTHPFIPPSLPPSLPHSFPPFLTHSLTHPPTLSSPPSLHPFLTHSLTHSLKACPHWTSNAHSMRIGCVHTECALNRSRLNAH